MEYILFIIVVFLTNIIQAITGFAGTMLAMPPGILLIGIDQARAILNIMGLLSCLLIVFRNRTFINTRELLKISGIMAVGILAGIALLNRIAISFLLPMYGLFIIVIATKKLLVKKEFPHPPWVMVLILFAAGLIHGMFVSGGSLLVIYAVSRFKDKTEFRSTLSAVWVLLNSLLLFDHVQSGYLNQDAILLTLACIIPLFLAVRLGTKLHGRVRQATFLKTTYVLLMISGISLL